MYAVYSCEANIKTNDKQANSKVIKLEKRYKLHCSFKLRPCLPSDYLIRHFEYSLVLKNKRFYYFYT